MKTLAIGMMLITGVFIMAVSTHLTFPATAGAGAIGGALLMAVVIAIRDRVGG